MSLFRILSAVVLCLAAASTACAAPPVPRLARTDRPPVTPMWAFEPWVWEDDENNAAAVWEMVDGMIERDIPLGAVILDSPWSEHYNDFVVDEARYPDFDRFVSDLNLRGVKVILWVTGMINKYDFKDEEKVHPLWLEGKDKGYFACEGETFKYWKARKGASFIDYANPEAVEWWHGIMDRTVSRGVMGFKVDGVDPAFPVGGCKTHGGTTTQKQWQADYYADMYEYLISRNPQAITMVRSVDSKLAYPKGFSPISHAPATWVGDQEPTWASDGFMEAIDNIFHAMKLGYAVIGSDAGGYLSGDLGGMMDKETYIRWNQFGALNTLYENGGHNRRGPWHYGEDAVRIYRYFAALHSELAPYFYSLGVAAHEGKGWSMKAAKNWQYFLGPFLYVGVLTQAGQTGRDIDLPKGQWINWWDKTRVHEGEQTVRVETPIDRYPLFVRRGAILPMNVRNAAAGHGGPFSINRLTLDLYPPEDGSVRFTVYEEPGLSSKIELRREKDGGVSVEIDPPYRDMLLRIGMERTGPDPGFDPPAFFDEATHAYYVKIDAGDEPATARIGVSAPRP